MIDIARDFVGLVLTHLDDPNLSFDFEDDVRVLILGHG